MSSQRLVTLAILLDMALQAASWAADSRTLDPHQAYAKQATWAETMIATRANCAEWAQSAKEGQVASTPLAARLRRNRACRMATSKRQLLCRTTPCRG